MRIIPPPTPPSSATSPGQRRSLISRSNSNTFNNNHSAPSSTPMLTPRGSMTSGSTTNIRNSSSGSSLSKLMHTSSPGAASSPRIMYPRFRGTCPPRRFGLNGNAIINGTITISRRMRTTIGIVCGLVLLASLFNGLVSNFLSLPSEQGEDEIDVTGTGSGGSSSGILHSSSSSKNNNPNGENIRVDWTVEGDPKVNEKVAGAIDQKNGEKANNNGIPSATIIEGDGDNGKAVNDEEEDMYFEDKVGAGDVADDHTIVDEKTTKATITEIYHYNASSTNHWLYGSLLKSSATNTTKSTTLTTIKRSTRVNRNTSQAFANRWCDLVNVKEWWPVKTSEGTESASSSSNTWLLRAPYFMMPGAKFGGTQELAALLHLHPQILPSHARNGYSGEVSFFYNRNFAPRYVHPLTEKTKVHAARERLFAVSGWDQLQKQQQKQQQTDQQQQQQQQQTTGSDSKATATASDANKKDVIAMDATPSYLFYSSILPRRILCVLPWIKLVVVLRDPVDRVLAQYNHARRYQRLRLSLEDWIENDLALLRKYNVISTNATTDSAGELSKKQKDEAWYKYLSRTVDGSIGRSLYYKQLRQWLQALKAVGKNPSDSVLLVTAEELVSQPEATLKLIYQFLHIDDTNTNQKDNTMPSASQTQSILSSLQASALPPVSMETRKRLDQFFKSSNLKLKSLIKAYSVQTVRNTKPISTSKN